MLDLKSFPWWARRALRAIYTRLKFQAIRIQIIDAKGEVCTLCSGTGWQVAKMDLDLKSNEGREEVTA